MVSDLVNEKRDTATVTRAERTREGRTYLPYCDILERENELLIHADLPGVRTEDIDINYERGLLTLQGRVDPRREDRRFLMREYGVGDYHRSFEVGEGIDASRIEAEVKDGVLTLHLPKTESIRPRKIAVRSA
mgnify:CR=1 FL=1